MKQILSFSAVVLSATMFAGGSDRTPANLKLENSKSVVFTENKGQVHDQNNQVNSSVLFSGKAGELTFHLGNSGISYQLYKLNGKEVSVNRLDINWINTNKDFTIVKGTALSGSSNYYSETGAVTDVRSYSDVTYSGIYKGIDLKWYDANGTLEYDFIVQPGADYKQIRMELSGAKTVNLNSDGDLEMLTPFGKVIEKAPVVKQMGKVLTSKWNLNNNVVSFEIEGYDPSKQMIIDPIIRTWGTYYGGTGNEQIYASAADNQGNIYVFGHTTTGTSTLIATVGSHQASFNGVQDAFLAKFNSAGTRLWATYYGGAGEEQGLGIATDNSGNVYVAGRTASSASTAISTVGSHQSAFGGGTYDGYLVKFNSSGVRQWATFYGGTGDEEMNTVAVNSNGDVYVSGMGTSTGTTIATPGSHQSVIGGGRDGFLVKFNSSGVRQWGTYYGGTLDDRGYACSVDASGNVYLCGDTQSNTGTVIATPGAHQVTHAGGYDGFLVKFDAAGTRQWGTYYGGTGLEYEPICKSDPNGNVYVLGYSNSTTGLATPGTHAPNYLGGANDSYLIKFNTSGVRLWGTYHGSSFDVDYPGKTFDVDANGNVYFGGTTNPSGTNGYGTTGSHQTVHAGAQEGFVVSFSPNGQKGWGTYYGGANADFVRAVVYYNGNIYASGETATSTGTIIATVGSHQSAYSGGTADGFLVKFNPSRGEALNFDGTNDYVNIGTAINTTLAPLNKITVESWVKPTSMAGLGNIVGNYATTNVGSMQFLLRRAANWEFFVGNSTLGTWSVVTSVVTPTLNVWQHVAGTWNGTVMSLYINGALSATAQCNLLSMGTQSAPVWIGGAMNGEYFRGELDEVRIWNRALCQGEIMNNMNSEIATTSPGLLANYHFNHGFASESNPGVTALSDFSGSNLTGTLTNFALSTSNSNWIRPGGVKSDSAGVAFTTPTISVNSGSICSGLSFTISPSGANTYTFQGGNAVVSPTANASYSVIGTTSLGCITGTTVSNVTVNPVPSVSVASSGSAICVGETATLTASGASTYSWNTGAGNASVAVSPTTTSAYTVVGTNTVGCSNTATLNLIVNICTSLNQLGGEINDTRLYPNPTNGSFVLELSETSQVKVMDITGRSVYTNNMAIGNYRINLSEFENGIYFVQILQNERSKTIKVVKE